MRLRPALMLALASLLAACEGSSAPVLTVELIDPGTGGNPALTIDSGSLDVRVEEDGTPRCQPNPCRASIERGQFSLELPIQTVMGLTRVQAEMTGGADPLVGASPLFGFGELLSSGDTLDELAVRVPMIVPGQCVAYEAPNVSIGGLPRLNGARRRAGVAVRRNIALVVGGLEDAGPSRHVDRYDQATAQMLEGLPDVAAMGETRGLTVSENVSLFVGQSAVVFRFEQGSPPTASDLMVHAGASGRSALARVDDDRFAIVAGDDNDGISWLTRVGVEPQQERLTVETPRRLLAPRTEPVVGILPNGDLLVLGGAAPGAPSAERVAVLGDGAAVPFDVGQGRGGWLVPSPSGRSFLWVGRVLEDGSVPGDTVLLSGCPDCVVSAGPEWTRPRPDATGASTVAGPFWIVGGGEPPTGDTDRVVWAEEAPRLDPGPALAATRSGASVVEHASGVVAVFGGSSDDPAGLRDDLELCLAAGGVDPF